LVDVNILVNDEDTWSFDYTVRFTFDDGRSFESSSNRDGVTGIILNESNRNHCAICAENPFIFLPLASNSNFYNRPPYPFLAGPFKKTGPLEPFLNFLFSSSGQ
jgi:hypothetical protein